MLTASPSWRLLKSEPAGGRWQTFGSCEDESVLTEPRAQPAATTRQREYATELRIASRLRQLIVQIRPQSWRSKTQNLATLSRYRNWHRCIVTGSCLHAFADGGCCQNWCGRRLHLRRG